ncbi:hypothetical protein KSP40_PGU000640 [Platanthera guangdongensis]|uniref:Uncharacterized protein n=1 Tax=Platanthera guangdongensis TaxID=2320717 RepID=A0ABR2MW47_9ASPA
MKRSGDALSKSMKKIAARDGRGNENKELTCAPSKLSSCCTSNRSSEASQPTGDGRGSDRETRKYDESYGERGGRRGDERGNDREVGRCSGSKDEFDLRISKLIPNSSCTGQLKAPVNHLAGSGVDVAGSDDVVAGTDDDVEGEEFPHAGRRLAAAMKSQRKKIKIQ